MTEVFQTERLYVRRWRGDVDTALAKDMLAILTPEVLVPLPPGMQFNGNDVAGWMAAQAREADLHLIQQPGSKVTLGVLILAPMRGGDVHIGYLFGKAAWCKGYATELVQGLVQAMAGQAGTRLIGGVAKDNPASARVLVKAGFMRDPLLSDEQTDQFTRQL